MQLQIRKSDNNAAHVLKSKSVMCTLTVLVQDGGWFATFTCQFSYPKPAYRVDPSSSNLKTSNKTVSNFPRFYYSLLLFLAQPSKLGIGKARSVKTAAEGFRGRALLICNFFQCKLEELTTRDPIHQTSSVFFEKVFLYTIRGPIQPVIHPEFSIHFADFLFSYPVSSISDRRSLTNDAERLMHTFIHRSTNWSPEKILQQLT